MIQFMQIKDVATFGKTPESLQDLPPINFIYGSNGSGKTTLSRILADEATYPQCPVSWTSGRKLETVVYNQDFIEKNFVQANHLPGVFTMGEDQAETLRKIEATKTEIETIRTRKDKLKENLEGADGKNNQLAKLHDLLKEQCWKKKTTYDAIFKDAFDGLRNDSKKFVARVLAEHASNRAELKSLTDLQERAKTLFGAQPTGLPPLPIPSDFGLQALAAHPILETCVVGKKDVDIAALIDRLNNSDWVRKGQAHISQSGGLCPFCQQTLPPAFQETLEQYFDQSYLESLDTISRVASDYSIVAEKLLAAYQNFSQSEHCFLDTTALDGLVQILSEKLKSNLRLLDDKRKESSLKVHLEPLNELLSQMNGLISAANAKISEHNRIALNFKTEQTQLKSEIWRFILAELSAELSHFTTESAKLDKAIAGLQKSMADLVTQEQELNKALRNLEKQTTSIQPTITGINDLLAQFGFHGFKLAPDSTGKAYQLVRSNGELAKKSLSEGEKTFVCFLYFYFRLKGSVNESGTLTERVAVIDDPVSSLDSEVLFIVGTLVKTLANEVGNNSGSIKQIFILSHNVYFFKEITHVVKGDSGKRAYWVVRKVDGVSSIQKHKDCPIKTSYDLLWEEVRNPVKSRSTLPNTLRRILENYFKILGGMDLDKLVDAFTGKEKIICRSLVSWLHDSSHHIPDDAHFAIDEDHMERYLDVFKSIFDVLEHGKHYEMMMGSHGT